MSKIEEFLKEYEKITKKYEVDFMAIPQYIPDENGGWKLIIKIQPIDLKELNKKEIDKAFISK